MAKTPAAVEPTETLNYKTWILKVPIHCGGCKKKVRKVLQTMEGVYMTSIDSRQHRVTVTGNVEAESLIKRLVKTGKHAEIWSQNSLEQDKNSSGDNNDNKNNNQQKDDENQNKQPSPMAVVEKKSTAGDVGSAVADQTNINASGKKKKKKKKHKNGSKGGGTGEGNENAVPKESPTTTGVHVINSSKAAGEQGRHTYPPQQLAYNNNYYSSISSPCHSFFYWSSTDRHQFPFPYPPSDQIFVANVYDSDQ